MGLLFKRYNYYDKELRVFITLRAVHFDSAESKNCSNLDVSRTDATEFESGLWVD